MAAIVVQRLSGESLTHRLSKTQPLSIGRHLASDVRIDEDGVAALHARISWNRHNYEITSAAPAGVEVNGTPVRHAELSDGDVIRVGSVDLTYFAEEPATVGSASVHSRSAESDEIPLRPISEDALEVADRPPPSSAERSERTRRSEDSSVRRKSESSKRRSGTSRAEAKPIAVPGPLDPWRADDIPDFDETEQSRQKPPEPPSLVQQVRERIGARPRRPGEQDALRSPLVLSLAGGALALLLTAAVIWFIIGRQSAQREYDAAVAELGQGKYTQAIRQFEQFLKDRPRHALAHDAWIGLGKARIERHVSGATPAWQPGLEALEQFIREHQDDSDFQQHHDAIRGYAEQIARGAARDAALARNRELLAVAETASRLLDRHSPRDDLPVKTQREIAAAMDKALQAIRKQETFDAATADIRNALSSRDPMSALRIREELLDRYPDLAGEQAIADLLAQTLKTEQALVESIEPDRQPLRDDHPSQALRPYVRVVHARLQKDDLPSDRPRVIAVARDCCYGIDAFTGEPVWRRVIGFSPPFFPMTVPSARPGVLLFDTNYNELTLLSRETGDLVWRLPLGESVSGPPLVDAGQIILPTRGGHLYKIDLETGRVGTALRFSQELRAPPALLTGDSHLAIAGDQAVLYLLSLRPLECRKVVYLGHKPGAIEAPLTPMGRLLLVAENDRVESCLLGVFDARDPEHGLPRIATARIEGQVRDQPALRGNQFFVPSSGERIAAFTVSDEPGQSPLTKVAAYQLQSPSSGTMYLSAGPDRQFWLATTALRKLKLGSGEIKPDSAPAIEGTASQPLELLGNHLYLGRHTPYSGAVQFSRADRDTMVGDWQVVLGARLIAWTPSGGSSAVCISETGDVFRISARDLETGGFDRSLTPQLNLPEDLRDPLRATTLPDGRIVVHSAGRPPRLWIVNASRQIERRLDLEQPLQTHPVPLRDGLILPLPGRLRFWQAARSGSPVEDYLAPIEMDQQRAWSHLLAMDDQHILTIDDRGRLARIQFRTEPAPHLFQVATVELGGPVDVAPCLHDGKLLVATGDRLQVLDAATLEPLAGETLDAPATNALWADGERAFIETGRRTLRCFQVAPEWKPLWSLPLGPAAESLAGAPLTAKDALLIALQGGAVWSIDPENGSVQQRLALPQPLDRGPFRLGDLVVAAAADGSLYSVQFPPAADQ